MNAADVMTKSVVSVKSGISVADAIELMLQAHISGLPVVDEAGRLVGIVTEGDFLRRAETGTERRRPHWREFLVSRGKLAEEYVQTHARVIDEVMTPDVVSATENARLGEIVELMVRHQIKRVPVLREGKLVGIVSRADLLRALAGLVRAPTRPTPGDDAIRERAGHQRRQGPSGMDGANLGLRHFSDG